MKALATVGLTLALSCWAATGAGAAVTVYDSAATFGAAVAGATNHGFEGIAPASSYLYGAVTVAGVTFDSNVFKFVIDGLATPNYGASFFSGQSPDVRPSDVLVSMAGVNAIGFTYGTYNSTPGTAVTIALSTGDSFIRSFPLASEPNTKFIGFVSGTPITAISLSSIANPPYPPGGSDYSYSLDIVSFTLAAAAVPEPASLALMLLGLGLVGPLARRARLNPATA